jgi:spermidine synthase
LQSIRERLSVSLVQEIRVNSVSPALLSLAVGFLSLSQEILWVRAVGFAFQSIPQAFSIVLALYLFGIAVGAAIGKVICARYSRLYLWSAGILTVSGLFDLVAPGVFAKFAHEIYSFLVLAPLVAGTALLKSIVFPIAHHLGSSSDAKQVGRSVSRVYFCNVVGSTFGPLVTGFLLLDLMSLQMNFVLMASLTLALAVACYLKEFGLRYALATAPLLAAIPFVLGENRLPVHLAQRMKETEITRFLENRHGIITIYGGAEQGDLVYGGNVYDGRTNLDPVINSNLINRALILSALQPKPQRALMIGLSTGAWLKLLTGFPNLGAIDVVEIDPGYLETIQAYPRIASALDDPRVTVHIDDGRRWLRMHPEDRYDLIVMNTTWHWRANATNLLSREFLQIIESRMNPGAIFAFNATGSGDAFKTAVEVFDHAYRYANFIYAADHDFRGKLGGQAAIDRLRKITLDGSPLFPPDDSRATAQLEYFVKEPFVEFAADQAKAERAYSVITDRNMLTEFRYGRSLYNEFRYGGGF